MAESKPLPIMTLGALGVVFGDIGTSPLYAVQQCFTDAPEFTKSPELIIGVLSLIVWSIILVVCIKYATFVLRADNEGEGGTLALLGLIRSKVPVGRFAMPGWLTLIVLFGSALLYGDGVVTPAISVLSAVEGLKIASPGLASYVVPIAIVILLVLFLSQQLGTERVGKLFGPVMVLWFAAIAVVGALSAVEHPAVLAAFNPLNGLGLLTGHGWTGYAVLGAVVLCFSGTEAMFADLGHFGRRPIVLGWYCVVLPALGLNYLGQGAELLANPAAASNPFFGIVPHWALYPMVLLATAATVIASQALISGAFSLTQQAINMGFAPRYAVVHTSESERGQIYMPVINYALMAGCLALVLGFQSSEALGAAYGLAVIGTMTVTSITFFVVTRRVWNWPLWQSAALCSLFLVIDMAFLGANLAKLFSGAWVPLLIGGFVFSILLIWTMGRTRFRQAIAQWSMPLDDFQHLAKDWTQREGGGAVFLTEFSDSVPLVGRHEWLRSHVSHEQVLLLRIETTRSPHVPESHRMEVEDLGGGIYRAVARFGFMHNPDIVAAMDGGCGPFESKDAVFFLPQITAVGVWPWWRMMLRRVYLFLGRTGLTPVEYFNLPPNRVISVGLELDV